MSWHKVKEQLTSLQLDDAPAGGALVIYHQGQKVVETAIGEALPNQAWSAQTLSVNFSIGKGVMATLIAILVSQGLLSYQMPISQLWPEFGTHNKASITLKQVLTHQAGLFNIRELTDKVEDLLDWRLMSQKVAQMSPDTPIDRQTKHYVSAYSALVSGWILGNVVEKATNLSLQQALNQFLAEPLGVAGELFYGLPQDKLGQVAKPVRYFYQQTPQKRKPILKPDSAQVRHTLANLPASALWQEALAGAPLSTMAINKLYFDSASLNLQNYKNALMPNGKDGLEYHRDEVMQAVIPAANGISTANALAKIYAMHANHGIWQGKTLIRPDVLLELRQVYTEGLDAVMPANMRWRLGFHRLFSVQPTHHAYGHMGYNGSVAFADPSRRLALAFVHNFDTTMLNDVRQFAVIESVIALVDTLTR